MGNRYRLKFVVYNLFLLNRQKENGSCSHCCCLCISLRAQQKRLATYRWKGTTCDMRSKHCYACIKSTLCFSSWYRWWLSRGLSFSAGFSRKTMSWFLPGPVRGLTTMRTLCTCSSKLKLRGRHGIYWSPSKSAPERYLLFSVSPRKGNLKSSTKCLRLNRCMPFHHMEMVKHA